MALRHAMWQSAPVTACRHQPHRAPAPSCRESIHRATRLVPCRSSDSEEVISNPLFTDAFKKVFSETLARTGGSIFDRETECYEEPCRSNQEEMILNSINASRQNLRTFKAQEKEIQATIEREKRQLDRLMTLLKLIETDAAYYRVLDDMIKEQGKAKDQGTAKGQGKAKK